MMFCLSAGQAGRENRVVEKNTKYIITPDPPPKLKKYLYSYDNPKLNIQKLSFSRP
jgi:hypothetical protein